MKIIDNKKDYYDYLMGVYGIDEKIVYDRRGSITYDTFFKNLGEVWEKIFKELSCRMTLKIGDVYYEFIRGSAKKEDSTDDYKWELPSTVKTGYWGHYDEYPNPRQITDEEMLKKKNSWSQHLDKLIVLSIDFPVNNKKYITPEGLEGYYNYTWKFIDNPILDGFDEIKKFITPDMIWNNLYDYIAHQYDKKIEDTRTDVQKLESAGFDKKTSFRNM